VREWIFHFDCRVATLTNHLLHFISISLSIFRLYLSTSLSTHTHSPYISPCIVPSFYCYCLLFLYACLRVLVNVVYNLASVLQEKVAPLLRFPYSIYLLPYV